MVLHLARRELLATLRSPLSWVVAGTWLALHGVMFLVLVNAYLRMTSAGPGWETDGVPILHGLLDPLYSAQSLFLLLLMPLLTMRSLAAEQSEGTLPLLLSSPVGTLEVVLGKWLGVMGFVGLLFLLAGYAPAALLLLGDPPPGPMLGEAAGLLLLAGALAAVGIAASSLTASQLVAAVLAWTLSLGSWLLAALESGDGLMASVARHASLLVHVRSFGGGLVRSTDVVWLVAVTGLFLCVAWQRTESGRWR